MLWFVYFMYTAICSDEAGHDLFQLYKSGKLNKNSDS